MECQVVKLEFQVVNFGMPSCKIEMPSCKIEKPSCKIGMPSCKIWKCQVVKSFSTEILTFPYSFRISISLRISIKHFPFFPLKNHAWVKIPTSTHIHIFRIFKHLSFERFRIIKSKFDTICFFFSDPKGDQATADEKLKCEFKQDMNKKHCEKE